jgi:hypothetical protein
MKSLNFTVFSVVKMLINKAFVFCSKLAVKLSSYVYSMYSSISNQIIFFLLRERKSEAIVPLKNPRLTRDWLLVEGDVDVVGGVEAGSEGDLEPGAPQRFHSGVSAGLG